MRLAPHNWKLRRWVDFRKCQTATATPAEPGGLPVMLGPLGMVEGERRRLILRRIQSYDPGWRSPDDYTVHEAGGDQSVGRIFRRYAAHPEARGTGLRAAADISQRPPNIAIYEYTP